MSATAIDPLVLNSLFDNQKKLDDVFNSIFDNDDCFISSVYTAPSEDCDSAYVANPSFPPKPGRIRGTLLSTRVRHPFFYLLPLVLEIAAIYWVVANVL
ncbi:hypothetical protein [Methylomonas sp. GJ1]|uniref:hypothetical protein n=1 Tax=Methylomonas sp. HYX-M1 TaxID=3139307 RepID=UPI001231AB0B